MFAGKDIIRTTRNSHCSNCGKLGHMNRSCKEPITSFGVICLRFSDMAIRQRFMESCATIQDVSLPMFNKKNNKNIHTAHVYNDSIKFLLIRRRHSLGMLEFVRGRYEPNDVRTITNLFRLMTTQEICLLGAMDDFRVIWDGIWIKNSQGSAGKSHAYEEEYECAKGKFDKLKFKFKDDNILGMSYYVQNIKPDWPTPEWGFPKGRRSFHERNVDCACREFEEETGYKDSDYSLLQCVQPLKEVFDGTNNIPYKHVYYLAVIDDNEKPPVIYDDNCEIGEVGWFTYVEALKMFRPYHIDKKKTLTDVFHFILSQLQNP